MESCSCLSSLANSLCGTKSTQRARYNEQEYTIEFENLIEEEDFYQPSHHIVSDVEKNLLKNGRFNELLAHQEMIGRKQEEMLDQQEEDARLEDEAYIEAKKEAARASKLKKPLDKNTLMKMRMNNSVEFSKWLAEEDIDVTSPNLDVEDFDAFLEKVKAKSAKKNSHSLDNESDHEHFEQTLQHSVQATILAGDALNALQPVELHAVTTTATTTYDISSTINHTKNTTRPFTPDFSSITSGGSSLTNTPLKYDETGQTLDDSYNVSIVTDTSFSSALSSIQSEAEATPTNKSDSTFIIDKTPVNGYSDLETTPKTAIIDTTTTITKAIVNTPQQSRMPIKQTPNTAASQPSNAPQSVKTKINQTLVTQASQQTKVLQTPASNGSIANTSTNTSSNASPVSSFKMVNTDSNNRSKTTSPSRAFDNSAFMEDFSTGDSLSDGDFDDDFGDFDTADGGFEELLT